MNELETLNQKGKTQTTQTMKYSGSPNPRVLILSQSPWVPVKWVEYFQIPSEELGVLTIKTGNKPLRKDTKELLPQYLELLNPEMIITIGSVVGKYFIPELNIKKDKGKLYGEDEKFGKYKMCTLMSPGWYKMQKWVSEWKQMNDLKNYLMNVMEYGI